MVSMMLRSSSCTSLSNKLYISSNFVTGLIWSVIVSKHRKVSCTERCEGTHKEGDAPSIEPIDKYQSEDWQDPSILEDNGMGSDACVE